MAHFTIVSAASTSLYLIFSHVSVASKSIFLNNSLLGCTSIFPAGNRHLHTHTLQSWHVPNHIPSSRLLSVFNDTTIQAVNLEPETWVVPQIPSTFSAPDVPVSPSCSSALHPLMSSFTASFTTYLGRWNCGRFLFPHYIPSYPPPITHHLTHQFTVVISFELDRLQLRENFSLGVNLVLKYFNLINKHHFCDCQ